MVTDDRVNVLYAAAISGRPSPAVDDEESELFDRMVVEIGELKDAGIAPDLPINDIFA